VVAGAACDQAARLREQRVVHAEERLAEADTARVAVVEEDARLVQVVRNVPGIGHRALVAGADREAEILPIAHQQELSHLLHREGQARHAVAAILEAERQRRHEHARQRQPVRRRVHLLLRQVELAAADVLVRVELDLLEAHDARHHAHVAVRLEREGGHRRQRGLSRRIGRGRRNDRGLAVEDVEDRDA
jgi:hypothetical protein